MSDQTSFKNVQSLQRCVGVSGSLPHNLHTGSCGQFCLNKLFAVKIFVWSSVQAKYLHLGSAFAFQIGWSRNLLNVPWNCMQQALFVVYSPSCVQRQGMLSCALSSSCIWLTSSQRAAYSLNSWVEVWGMMCEIQRLSSRPFCTVKFFLLDFLQSSGAITFGDLPPTHDAVQNLAVLPSPTITTVDAANNSLSQSSTGRSNMFQALSGCFHWNHNHLSLNALDQELPIHL